MVTRRSHWKLALLLFSILVAGALFACEPQDTGPKAWIDEPMPGVSFPAGEPVKITYHAYARDGVAEVLISVNGEPLKRGVLDDAEVRFSRGTDEWMPAEAGDYRLEVKTFDVNGQSSPSAAVDVRVVKKVTMKLRGTPTVSASSTPEIVVVPTDTPPSALVISTDTPVAIPVKEPTPTWTSAPPSGPTGTTPSPPTMTFTPIPPTATATTMPTDTPWPQAQIDFRADRTSLEKGQCTTLRWDVEYASAIYLNGGGVVGHGTEEVCPDSTKTYTLRVDAPRGGGERQVTIQISAPQDNSPPPVPSPMEPGNGSSVPCAKSTHLTWSPVKDASGISGYYLKMEHEWQTGSWSQVWEWGPTSSTGVDAPVDCGGQYRWAVRARDKAGNESGWSGWSSFRVQ
jgi:hypothetical protein